MTQQKKKKVKVPKTKEQKRLRIQRIIAGFLIFCLTIGIAGTTGVLIFAQSANKEAPEMKEEDFFRQESTKLADVNGNTFYETGLKMIENITYDDLPQVMIDALISVEDSRFFQHDGVDVPRFAKAMITNGLDTIKKGRVMFSQGGSTLTMQLIKNTYFTYENAETNEVVEAASSGLDGIKRKFQELKLARQLEAEQIITKKQTIALYLNTANFGAQDNILGIQNSAEKYFGKDVADLTLVESAFLAGVLNAPEYYSPYKSIKNAKERTATVIYYMNYHGYITDEEYELALSVDLENLLKPISRENQEVHPYQAYADLVLREVPTLVKDADGNGVQAASGGMTIYTAMNPNIQEGIEKVQRREIANLDQGASTNIQVGSAVVNNKTGEIVGILGGYDYKGKLVFNNAADNYSAPASVVKPLLSYALAFEYLGYATSHVALDVPYTYAGTNIPVGNYDGRYIGELTIMHAVADSRNTTALRTLDEVISKIGNEGVIKYLEDFGFSKTNTEGFVFNNQYAIGGENFGTTTLELAGAYAGMMNGGNYIKPHTITRIEFDNGREPIVNSPSSVNALSDSAAYLAAQTMKYAVEGPYPGYLRSIKKPYTVYGKTGTHRWDPRYAPEGAPRGAQKARLMIAATGDYSTATWIGFVKTDADLKPWISASEADFNLTGKLSSYLLDLLANEYGAPAPMARPSGVADIKHILGTWPYQVPLEDMNPDLIATGMIKKDYLKLVEATPQELSDLKESKVSATQKGDKLEIAVAMSEYPDKEKLTIAPATLDMTNDGKGVRLFDESWIFGAVRYKSEVKVNGAVVQEKVGEEATQTFSLDYKYTDKIEVCSYYTYDLSPTKKSNILCSALELKEPEITVPKFTNKDVSELMTYVTQNNLNVSYVKVNNSDLDQFNKVTFIEPAIDGLKTTMSALQAVPLKVNVNDYTYTLPYGTKAKNFASTFKNYLSVNYDKSSSNAIVKGLDFGNGETDSFNMSDVYKKQVTLILEDEQSNSDN